MIWEANYINVEFARYFALMPGDVIRTGTPAHPRSLEVGDSIEVEVTNLARLKSTVVAIIKPRANGAGHTPMVIEEVRRVVPGLDDHGRKDLKSNYIPAERIRE